MRIVSRDEFLLLPEGTVFFKFSDVDDDGPLSVKGATMGNDFAMRDLTDIASDNSGDHYDKLKAMRTGAVSHPLNPDYIRDGCFSGRDRFLVYEREDVVALVQALLPATVNLQLVEVEGR